MNQSNPDSYILIIKDEPYEAILVENCGLINQTVDADLEIKERWYTINGKKIPEVNILWHVKGLTPETASSLDTKEQILLLKDYLHGQRTITSIKNHQDRSIALAKRDYDIAVCNIFEKQDYETSCNASIRFACQILKSKLLAEERVSDDNLPLKELAGRLGDRDFKEIEDIIQWLQRSPEDDEIDCRVTLEDAVNAVRSSVALFAKLFDKKDDKNNRGFMNISS